MEGNRLGMFQQIGAHRTIPIPHTNQIQFCILDKAGTRNHGLQGCFFHPQKNGFFCIIPLQLRLQ